MDESEFRRVWEAIWEASPDQQPQNGTVPPPEILTMDELLEMDLQPTRWVVQGVLPEGLSLLAARPKLGKSWLAFGMAVQITHHLDVFGTVSPMEVEPASVLYLALEDTWRRLRDRYEMMTQDWPVDREARRRLALQIRAPRLDEGCIAQITHWIDTAENPRLVIVDTLSKVRPSRHKEGDAYSESYADVHLLKELADTHGIAVMVIHHTRKTIAEDALEEVLGSTGFTGAADSIMVFKRRRGEPEATLLVTGRDVEDTAISLRWDIEKGLWLCTGMGEYTTTPVRHTVLEFLVEHRANVMTTEEIAKAAAITNAAARMQLARLQKMGKVKKMDAGGWKLITPQDPEYDQGNQEDAQRGDHHPG